MNGNDYVIKMVLRVYLVTGQSIDHVYDMPSKQKDVDELLDRLVKSIYNAMKKEKPELLHLNNPLICYNIDNVIGIEIKGVTSKQIEDAIKKAQKKAMGFTKQSTS